MAATRRRDVTPLLLAAALAALCRTAAAGSCAAGSPSWCFGGSNSSGVSLIPLIGFYAFTPTTSGNCSCVSYVYEGITYYAAAGPAELAQFQGTNNVQQCTTNYCNCNTTACVNANPFAPGGACSATPSTGVLQCRKGFLGVMNQTSDGDTTQSFTTYSLATAANLASTPYPAGSMCFSTTYTSSGSNFTQYYGGNVTDCFMAATAASQTNNSFSACATNNCGAPVPTGPQCPAAAASNATSCYVGIDGPSAAVAIVGMVPSLGLTAPYTPASKAGGPTCISGTVSCATMVAVSGGLLTATQCPTGSSLSIYTSAAAVSAEADEGDTPSCSDLLQGFSASLNVTALLGCGTSNCNAPTSTVYVAATATLDGYTTATFGTAETAQFSRAMASSLGVAASSVTVTGVSAAPAPAGRRLLSGVVVAFTVATTVSSSATLTTALAAPLSATTFQAAGLTQVTTVAAAPAASTATPPTPIVAASLPQTGSGAAPASAAPASARASVVLALAAAALVVAMSA